MIHLERTHRVEFVRPFTLLNEELSRALSLIIPRLGIAPRVAMLKLTDACQMDCLYCDANQVNEKPMNTIQTFKVLDHLAEAGIQTVDLTGGEPTLRKDLLLIVSHAKELGMLTTISSNGGKDPSEASYQYWYDLAEAGLFGANLSYDGIGEKADREVFELADFLINKLHIYSGIRMVVWEENLDKVYEIAQLSMLNNIFSQAVPAVALDGQTSASPKDFQSLNYEGRKKLVEILSQTVNIRGPFAAFQRIPKSYLRDVVASPDPNSWHCHHPSSHWISVNAQGQARVCNDVPLTKTYLLTEDRNPLLNKQFHRDVDGVAEKCKGCSWCCHYEANRGQLERGLDHLRLVLTIAGLT